MSGFGGIFSALTALQAGRAKGHVQGQQIQYERKKDDYERQRQQAQDAQGNQQAALQMALLQTQANHAKAQEQREAFDASEEGQRRKLSIAGEYAKLQQVKNPVNWQTVQRADGSTVQLNPETGETREVTVGGQPLITTPKSTENIDPLSKPGIEAALARLRAEKELEAKYPKPAAVGEPAQNERLAASMEPRLVDAGATLDQAPQPNLVQQWMSKVPFGIGNAIASPSYQTFDNAGRQFVSGVLRPESGANINEEEIRDALKRYVPAPGDSPELRAQKKHNRELAEQQLSTMAGRAAPTGPAAQAAPPGTSGRTYRPENPFR